jgi:hypothetical protein
MSCVRQLQEVQELPPEPSSGGSRIYPIGWNLGKMGALKARVTHDGGV